METRKLRGDARLVRRGTLLGEAVFALAAIAIAVRVIADSIYNVACTALFIGCCRVRARRRRMLRLIAGAAGTAACLVLATAVFSGCASRPATVDPGNSWTLKGQMEELRWSIHTTVDQSDARASLESDLQDLKEDPHWKENLRFDVENLFTMPDAQKSLESDLRDLGDDDSRKHGLRETIEMLGW